MNKPPIYTEVIVTARDSHKKVTIEVPAYLDSKYQWRRKKDKHHLKSRVISWRNKEN